MNLKDKHTIEKPVSAQPLFKGEGTSVALQILKGHQLKAHITKIPALLICITGQVVYEEETGTKVTLHPGDFINIEANIKHWIDGVEDSQLILLK
ncbi:MAG TPA: hypothetical protein VIK89_00310 [Cytophagaceae bacterium]